jgi:hypothetical protein
MRLSEVLALEVTRTSRSRGYSYFASGAVRQLEALDGVIRATVYGTAPYDVVLEPNGTQILASCTCPYFVDRFDVCKHLWATLLAAEAKHLPLLAPGVSAATVSFELIDPDGAASGFDDTIRAGRAWSPAVDRRPYGGSSSIALPRNRQSQERSSRPGSQPAGSCM